MVPMGRCSLPVSAVSGVVMSVILIPFLVRSSPWLGGIVGLSWAFVIVY